MKVTQRTPEKPQESPQRKSTSEPASPYHAHASSSSSESEPFGSVEKKAPAKVSAEETTRSPYKYPKTAAPAQSPQLNQVRSNISGHSGSPKPQPSAKSTSSNSGGGGAGSGGARHYSQHEKAEAAINFSTVPSKQPTSNNLITILDEVFGIVASSSFVG